MKKIILLALFCLSINVFAQNKQTIVTPFSPGSVVDAVCRKIFELYDQQHNTVSTVQNVVGADQIIGHKQFLTMQNSLLCAGNGVAGVNQILSPNISPSVDTLKPIINVLSFTHFIYSPSKNISLRDLYKKDKPLLIGAPSNNTSKLLTHVLDQNNVKYEVVVYRKPTDAIVSLKEGALDLYIDGGSIKNSVENISEIKEIAHISVKSKSKSENLYTKYPLLGDMVSKVIIFANTDMTDSAAVILNRQLYTILTSDEFDSFYKQRIPYHTLIAGTLKETESSINNAQKVLKDVYN